MNQQGKVWFSKIAMHYKLCSRVAKKKSMLFYKVLSHGTCPECPAVALWTEGSEFAKTRSGDPCIHSRLSLIHLLIHLQYPEHVHCHLASAYILFTFRIWRMTSKSHGSSYHHKKNWIIKPTLLSSYESCISWIHHCLVKVTKLFHARCTTLNM